MIIHSLEELNEVLLGDDGEVELLGTPTTTEPPEGSDDLRIATTAFVRANGSTTVVSNELDSTSVVDALSANMGRVLDVDKADLASPAFTGIPTIKVGEADLAVATESYVITNSTKVNVVDGVVSASATDALSANQGRLLDGAKANLASPVFTGDPTAKTQDSGNSSKRLATTEFVMDNSSQNTGTVTAVTGGTGITTGGSATAITLSHTAHTGDVLGSGSNTSLTIKDSVALGGNPTTTTQSSGNNSTRIATTAFVLANSSDTTIIDDLASNSATSALSANQGRNLNESKANLASPSLTGIPLAPTAGIGENTTQIATTAFVLANSSAGDTCTDMDGGLSDVVYSVADIDLESGSSLI